MKTVAEMLKPRENVFLDTTREDVLNLSDFAENNIDSHKFFSENFKTEGMKTLLDTAFSRFSGESNTGVIKLTQAMGGGKTHNMLALALLAKDVELRRNIVGEKAAQIGEIKVVAFSGRDNADYGIWGVIAEQLGKKEFFKDYYSPLKAPGESAWVSLLQGEKVLILLDELPPYLENAKATTVGNSDLSKVTITALSNLFVAIGKAQLANVCLVFSDLKAAYESGSDLLQSSFKELEQEANRVALEIAPVNLQGDEIFSILKKRLFEDTENPQYIADVNEIAKSYMSCVEYTKKAGYTTYKPETVFKGISESYPFHPSIRDLYARFNENAVNLCDFVIEDMQRIAKRTVIGLQSWREESDEKEVVPAVTVEDPIYRKEFGLWEHQKYFIELAFREHKTKGGARFILADQVGLGKTVQLAMSAKLMALYGDKPILIIVPKTLVWQWQDEIKSLLDMPSAVWTGKGWQDENGYFYQAEGIRSISKCPRKVGIVSQGLVSRQSEAAEILKQLKYECVIVDEAHRARRRNPGKDPDSNKANPNYLLEFINEISLRTKSLLLATATPVQINTIEAFDLINALSLPHEAQKIMGDEYSQWHKKPQQMLDMVCGKIPAPDSELAMWDIMRNPFPPRTLNLEDKVNPLRDKLDISDDEYVLKSEVLLNARPPLKKKILDLYNGGDFIANYNPYIRHIVRRTRDFLENTINPDTHEPYLKKINVLLYGEDSGEALPLDGYLKQAYLKAQEFCDMLSARTPGGGFMSTMLLKRIGSTILAGENTAKKMLAWTEEGKDILKNDFNTIFDEEDDIDDNSEIKSLTKEEIACLRDIVLLLSKNHDNDPKYNATIDILKHGTTPTDKAWAERGCIIFSQYYDSSYFVAHQISTEFDDKIIGLYAGGDKSGYFKKGVFVKQTKDNIKTMVKRREIKILVGTDAASEGLNLQTLSTLINLDLPWNPTRLEQRKGRIQRIGQESDTIRIYNMRYKDSVEDRVHNVLSERLGDIYAMFGQIPDTLEDVWIDVAKNNIDAAKERIDILPKQNPFNIKYENKLPKTEDWSTCTYVLDKGDKEKQLLIGW